MRFILVAVSLSFAFLFSGCGGGGDIDNSWRTTKHSDLENYFKSTEEPIVKDAIWTQKNFFKVGVFDDGTDRSGYALYVCQILSDKGMSNGVTVHVIDIIKLSAQGKWVKLGQANC